MTQAGRRLIGCSRRRRPIGAARLENKNGGRFESVPIVDAIELLSWHYTNTGLDHRWRPYDKTTNKLFYLLFFFFFADFDCGVRFVLFFSFVCSRLRRVFFFSFDQVLPSADLLLLARMLEKKEEGAREIRKSFGFWCGTEMNLKKTG